MDRLVLIYLISFGLLGYIHRQGPQYIFQSKTYPQLAIFKTMHAKLAPRFKNREDLQLLMSYTCGGSKKLSAATKRYHRALNLQHLFSPSGLHLAAAYAWILPLFAERPGRPGRRRWWFIFKRICLIILYALPWGLPGYYAIKRICLLKIAYLIVSPFKRPDYFIFFLIMMGIDFCGGTFKQAPLSYAYSFLFLGTILATRHLAPFQQAAALLGGQIITNFFALQSVTLIGHFIGQLITVGFALCFPLFLVGFWGNYFFDWSWIQWPLKWWQHLITASGQIALNLGSFYPSLNILAAGAVMMIKVHPPAPAAKRGRLKLRLKLGIITLLLIGHSDPCFNQSRAQTWQQHYHPAPLAKSFQQ